MERFIISTINENGNLHYRIYDKLSQKFINCGIGELNKTIWKLLGV